MESVTDYCARTGEVPPYPTRQECDAYILSHTDRRRVIDIVVQNLSPLPVVSRMAVRRPEGPRAIEIAIQEIIHSN